MLTDSVTVTVLWMSGCSVLRDVQGRLANFLWLADSLLGMVIDVVADRLTTDKGRVALFMAD